jgi:gas vesicle protein
MSESTNGGGGGGGFFAGFVLGALAGAALAYLVSQEEARDTLIGKAREAGNFAVDATGDLRGRVSEAATAFGANASDLYSRGKSVVDNARTNVDAAVDEGRSTAEQLKTDLNRQSSSSPSQTSES